MKVFLCFGEFSGKEWITIGWSHSLKLFLKNEGLGAQISCRQTCTTVTSIPCKLGFQS